MTLFGVQIACGMHESPVGMEHMTNGSWDGEDCASGFVKGRRYVWMCPDCGHMICVNMKEMDE